MYQQQHQGSYVPESCCVHNIKTNNVTFIIDINVHILHVIITKCHNHSMVSLVSNGIYHMEYVQSNINVIFWNWSNKLHIETNLRTSLINEFDHRFRQWIEVMEDVHVGNALWEDNGTYSDRTSVIDYNQMFNQDNIKIHCIVW